MIAVTVEKTYPMERLVDLITCGLEGGSNYWYENADYSFTEEARHQVETLANGVFAGYWAPFFGGSLTLEIRGNCEGIPFWAGNDWATLKTDEPGRSWVLDLDAVRRGLDMMSRKYPSRFADFESEQEDACTGDIFLQLAMFGELVFG